jgi:hypothetical protein
MLELKKLLPKVSFFFEHPLAFFFSLLLKEHFLDHPYLFELSVFLLADHLSLMFAFRFCRDFFRPTDNCKCLIFLNGFKLAPAFNDLLLLESCLVLGQCPFILVHINGAIFIN